MNHQELSAPRSFERPDVLIVLRCAKDVSLSFVAGKKNQWRAKNKLTSEIEVDNLEKFAKTSLTAEVIIDRPHQRWPNVRREIEVSSKYRR
jgi:hypothetical protein